MLAASRAETAHELVEIIERQCRAAARATAGQPRRGAHRREIAQVDRERAVTDGVGRREAAVEVHAVDQRVDGQHLEPVALRLHDRAIVADADHQPVGRWPQHGLDRGDEFGFGEVRDGLTGG